MEMREDIKGLKTTVDAIAKDQALGWDAAFGSGDQSISIGRSGRGERS
jgi:hypothetical protein